MNETTEEQRHEKSCGSVIYRKDENDEIKYLIILHSVNRGGHWDFPKGKMQEGESEKETALREVLEETGLSINMKNDFREEVEYSPSPGVMKTVVFFLAKPDNLRITLDEEEVEDFEWLSFDEAKDILTYQTGKDLLQKANAFLATQ